ncbi:MAG: sodium ion-translocating decarboxylase subunit beta, partial [Phaeodactylibacter sp.]|nr:sodium ion-translocating decarboxylase subunit beta [Phaeodactylibacter sp.]
MNKTIVLFIIIISWLTPGLSQSSQQKNQDTLPTGQVQVETPAADADKGDNVAAWQAVRTFYEYTGFANVKLGNIVMILVGLFFIFLAIQYHYEPLLLIPIGLGILLGNVPFKLDANLQIGIYEPGSVLNYLYFGVIKGIYPPLIFLGIGAMTDFSSLISNPRLMLLGAAAQIGIFATFIGALMLGFYPAEAGAIGIIGGADGPTAIFLSSKLANGVNIIDYTASGAPIYVQNLIGPIAIAAYSYMALVPVL